MRSVLSNWFTSLIRYFICTVAAKKRDENWQEKLYTECKEYINGGKLRDYQLEGLNWLLRCWYTKMSSILADEMGKCLRQGVDGD